MGIRGESFELNKWQSSRSISIRALQKPDVTRQAGDVLPDLYLQQLLFCLKILIYHYLTIPRNSVRE